MFRNEPWPAGTPCWADCTFQPEHRGAHHAHDFYGKLFGWELQEGPEEYGGYTIALKDEAAAAALSPATDEDQVSDWTVYIATDDVAATAAAVTATGGKVLAGPMEIPGSGHAAYCEDPQGAAFALWQSAGMDGYGIFGEPGAVGWHSLYTTDVAHAREFYGRVFGWSFDESGAGSLPDGSRVASIAPLLDELTPAPTWVPMFIVADADSTAAIAQELDGHILNTSSSQWGADAWLEGPGNERFQIHSFPDKSADQN